MQNNNRRTLRLEALESRELLATLVVSSADDSGVGTLRQAIIDSNQLGGRDEITFDLPDDELWIRPESPLPTITDPVTVDAATQPGYVDAPVVSIVGAFLDDGASGLTIEAHDVTIRGLAIEAFPHAGILVNQVQGAVVESNYLGLSSSGVAGDGNSVGIHLYNASGATIGGAEVGNVISGNKSVGVFISGPNATNNRVQGNLVGTDPTGMTALPNVDGMRIVAGAHNNVIGAEASAQNANHGNVISGNLEQGIEINASSNNVVAGNLVGPAVDGRTRLDNQRVGVFIINGSNGNLVGGSSPEEANVVSGHSSHGVFIRRSSQNRVSGNRIGTTADGLSELANNGNGVWVTYTSGNVIGTNGDGVGDEFEGNLISGNGCGIYFGVAYQNTIARNLIGTDVTGTAALPNSVGAHLGNDSSQNTIGTNGDGVSDLLEQNIISGNDRNAIELNNASRNSIAGNWLGLGADESVLSNGHSGVWVHNGSQQNIIGGRTETHRNVISGNLYSGVAIAADNNEVLGNYIGTSPDGLSAAGNHRHNIRIWGGASATLIGGDDPHSRNVIAAAGENGIMLDDGPLTVILGNWIGIGSDGETLLGNAQDGIAIHGGTVLVTIGGSAADEGNVIAGNAKHGIETLWMWDSFITGNTIGATVSGATASNGESAIRIYSSINIHIGDGTEAGANLITSIGSPAIAIVGDSQSVYLQRSEITTDSLPMDLGDDGPSPNDPNDFDFGPNLMQNYRPILAVSNNLLYSTVTVGPVDALETPYFDFAYAVSTDQAGLQHYRYLSDLENLIGNGPDSGGIYKMPSLETGERVALISYDETNGSSEFSPPVEVTANLIVTLIGGDQYDEGEMITGEIARGNLPMDMPVNVRLSSQDLRIKSVNVTIPAGDSSAEFVMAIDDDSRAQETRPLVLLAAADAVGATGSASFTIRRSDTWHNDLMPLDSTGDSNVAPNDVLAVVNWLNSGIAGLLPIDNKDAVPFVDVNGDGYLSPIDALQIINFLNSAADAEGEQAQATDEALASLSYSQATTGASYITWVEEKRKDGCFPVFVKMTKSALA